MEIRASELRIGNLIYENGEVKRFTPGMLFSMFNTEVLSKEGFDDRIKPIPLSEEWLLKFGMRLYDGFSNTRFVCVVKHKYDTSLITFSPNEGIVRFSNGQQKGSTLIPHIKYVHQFQNLYHAFTGKELTIKEYEKN